MSLSKRDEIYPLPIADSEYDLYTAATSGNNDTVITLLMSGVSVGDYRILVEKVDESGHKDTALIIKNYFEQPWLLNVINYCEFTHKRQLLSAIYYLSANRIAMLEKISKLLITNGKFTENILAELITRIAQKNLKINLVSVEKSKDDSGSMFTSNRQILFYQDQRAIKSSALRGTRGVITQGFLNRNSREPAYAVKWMDSISYAKREAKSQQRLGRMQPTIFHHRDKSAVMMEWRSGKTLGNYSTQDFKSHSLLGRLKCLIDLLIDLNKLHASLHCHFDLNGGNVLIDLDHETMSLIDFELAAKPYDKLAWQGDMNSFGEIIETMIPEIIQKTELSSLEKAIFDLRDAMRWHSFNVSAIPTSEQALQYCQELYAEAEHLDTNLLKAIADRTINRTEPTVEDMVRLCERSTFIKPG